MVFLCPDSFSLSLLTHSAVAYADVQRQRETGKKVFHIEDHFDEEEEHMRLMESELLERVLT